MCHVGSREFYRLKVLCISKKEKKINIVSTAVVVAESPPDVFGKEETIVSSEFCVTSCPYCFFLLHLWLPKVFQGVEKKILKLVLLVIQRWILRCE